MARNKHPEQTVEQILEVSLRLFSEKGYEKTTMQDIVNALGMSKGAIYHHFKSKEELIDAVTTHGYFKRNSFANAQMKKDMNGLERLRWSLLNEFGNSEKQQTDQVTKPIIKEPKFMMRLLQSTIQESAPLIADMIEESKQDGSCQVEDVKMTAEVFMILANIWANPILWQMNEEDFIRKLNMFDTILRALGLPVMNDELYQTMIDYYHNTLPA